MSSRDRNLEKQAGRAVVTGMEFDIRSEAARRFNRLVRGHRWEAADMGLFEVHVKRAGEGALPPCIWMPLRGIDALRSVKLSLGIVPSKVRFVRRLSEEDEVNCIRAAATFEQRVQQTLP